MPKTMPEPRKPLPSASELHALFAYDLATGLLTTRVATKMRPAGSEAGHITPGGYRRVILAGDDRFMAHRVIWKMMTGQEPPEFVDHIDGNRLNDAWANLREADEVTNARNVAAHKRNKLGVEGVSVCAKTGKYLAFIREDGRNRQIGRFATVGAAAAAYRDASVRAFGDYAREARAA